MKHTAMNAVVACKKEAWAILSSKVHGLILKDEVNEDERRLPSIYAPRSLRHLTKIHFDFKSSRVKCGIKMRFSGGVDIPG